MKPNMAINFLTVLPLALMSEHRETGASPAMGSGGDSYEPPQTCTLNPILPQAGTGIIPQLDTVIKAELAKLGCHKNPSVKLTGLSIGNKTFAIGDIVFYFQKGVPGYKDTTVSVELSFEKTSDGNGAVLHEAVYRFSSPVLAGANIEVRPFDSLSIGGVARVLSGQFNDQDVVKILEGMAVAKYDKSTAGTITNPVVPTMIAFDEIRMSADKNGSVDVRFALTNKECHKRGWGLFSFGVSRDGCVASKKGDEPGEFLGNGWGGGKEDDPVGVNECRSTEMGERTRMAFVAWMIKGRQDSYNSFLRQSSQDSVAAMAFLMNEVMGIRAKQAPDNWQKFAKEEFVLGRGYSLWRTQMASQK